MKQEIPYRLFIWASTCFSVLLLPYVLPSINKFKLKQGKRFSKKFTNNFLPLIKRKLRKKLSNYITIIQRSVIFALHVTTDIVWGFSSCYKRLENEFANEQQCYVGTSLKTSYLDIYGCHRDQFPIFSPFSLTKHKK